MEWFSKVERAFRLFFEVGKIQIANNKKYMILNSLKVTRGVVAI